MKKHGKTQNKEQQGRWENRRRKLLQPLSYINNTIGGLNLNQSLVQPHLSFISSQTGGLSSWWRNFGLCCHNVTSVNHLLWLSHTHTHTHTQVLHVTCSPHTWAPCVDVLMQLLLMFSALSLIYYSGHINDMNNVHVSGSGIWKRKEP